MFNLQRIFKSFEIHPYFVCQPAIIPISDGRIEPVFPHYAEYQCATTDLFWLRFIHCAIVSLFILYCFSFSLNGDQKGEKLLRRCQWIVTAYTYYIMQMTKYMCKWLYHPWKILTSAMFLLCTDSSQPGWFHD